MRAEARLRMATFTALLTGIAVASAGPARAQVAGEITVTPPAGNPSWSATAGETLGSGNSVVLGEVGWPGISAQYSRGLDEKSDIGLRASFLYGFEGTTNGLVGMNLAVPYKRNLSNDGKIAVAIHADPGVTLYGNNGLLFGVGGPVGVVAGYKLDDKLTLDAGADIPVLVSFANPSGVLFGPQVGVGAEYAFDKDMAVTFRSRVGPEFAIVSGGSGSAVTFSTLVGLAYKMH
jgi:hypothetical protein